MLKVIRENNRYPHHVVITRLIVPDNPFEETDTDDDDLFGDGEIEQTEDVASDEEQTEDVRYEFPPDDEEMIHDVTVVLYDGIGRTFTDTTTTGDTHMDMNRRKCSIPVRFDEWTHEVLDGDRIAVKVGDVTYSGEVKDIEPDNDRTLIYWERPRVTD